jgi:hypothetical protein
MRGCENRNIENLEDPIESYEYVDDRQLLHSIQSQLGFLIILAMLHCRPGTSK